MNRIVIHETRVITKTQHKIDKLLTSSVNCYKTKFLTMKFISQYVVVARVMKWLAEVYMYRKC